MSIYQQINGKLVKIPSGGVPKDIVDRIESIESSQASETKKGLVKLSSLTDVTESDGLALPTRENNASIEGTIANRIQKINYGFNDFTKQNHWEQETITIFGAYCEPTSDTDGVKVFKNQKGERWINGLLAVTQERRPDEQNALLFELPDGYELDSVRANAWGYMISASTHDQIALILNGKRVYHWGNNVVTANYYVIDFKY